MKEDRPRSVAAVYSVEPYPVGIGTIAGAAAVGGIINVTGKWVRASGPRSRQPAEPAPDDG